MEITKEMIERVQKLIVRAKLQPKEYLGEPIIEFTGSVGKENLNKGKINYYL